MRSLVPPMKWLKKLEPLGFDRVYGSIFEEKCSIFTGRIVANLILGEVKAEYTRNICEELDVDLSRSVAFGDTDQDVPLMRLVGSPIAINPNARLKEICALKGWKLLESEDLDDLDGIKGLLTQMRNRKETR